MLLNFNSKATSFRTPPKKDCPLFCVYLYAIFDNPGFNNHPPPAIAKPPPCKPAFQAQSFDIIYKALGAPIFSI
jgi:hypothetical protein